MEVPPSVIAAAAGLVGHCILSAINEVPTIPFLNATGFSEAVLLAYLVRSGRPLLEILQSFSLLNAAFWSALIAVTLLRRLYIHPLRKYPGKKLAALSKLYEAYLNFIGRQGLELKELHQKHGIIIRTGPNEISINDVDVLQLLHRQPYVSRGPFYEIAAMMGEFTVFTVRDNNLHKQWRGIWEQAFKPKALKDYEPRVEKHVLRFVEALEANSAGTVDITESTANMAFDILADLGFGIDHSVKGAQGDNSYMEFLHGYLRISVAMSSIANIWAIFPYLPQDAASKSFRRNGLKMLENRIAMGTGRADIFSHLLGEDTESGTRFTPKQLGANAHLTVVAGTDTTSSLTANILRELSMHSQIQEKLYAEIKQFIEENGPLTCVNVKSLGYLQAVIDESLRLWNPVPSGVQAMTGPDGATVAGHFIPPRTVVRVPHHPLMTDARYFADPEKFWPERWLNDRQGVKNIKAFIPFSYGAHVCPGKQLALTEVRLVVACAIEKFAFRLDEKHDDGKWHREWQDYQTLTIGSILVKLEKRN